MREDNDLNVDIRDAIQKDRGAEEIRKESGVDSGGKNAGGAKKRTRGSGGRKNFTFRMITAQHPISPEAIDRAMDIIAEMIVARYIADNPEEFK